MRKQLAAEKKVSDLKEKLKTAKEELRTVSENELPDLMDTLNLATIVTKKGFAIVIKKDWKQKLPKKNKTEALKWLGDNKRGDIIKRQVSVPFVVGQEEEAEALLTLLQEKYGPLAEMEKNVAAPTLKATLKQLLEDGVDVPLKLFGMWEQRVAKIN